MGAYENFAFRSSRLVELAEVIEQSPEFNMSSWRTCIAAHCCATFNATPDEIDREGEGHADVYYMAAARLALDVRERRKLMIPNPIELDLDGDDTGTLAAITRPWAAATLRDFAETGRVDWLKNKPSELDDA